MGIDVAECHSVILYGPPKNPVDLVQLIGRVGRDGALSAALILYHSYHIRNIEQEIKPVLTENKCHRQELMKSFMSDSELESLKEDYTSNLHTCCDSCAEICACGQCSELDIEKLFKNIDISDSSSDSDTEEYEHGFWFDHISDDDLENISDLNEDAS